MVAEAQRKDNPMTCRPLFLVGAFAVGVICGMLLLKHFGASVTAQQANAPVTDAADRMKLEGEVDQLKGKATDQAHVMVSVAYHFNNLWFAAEKRNWPLAEFYLNETRSHLRWAVRVIPIRKNTAGQEVQLGGILEALENTQIEQLRESIKAKDHPAFVDAYKAVLEGCNACHGASEKDFIHAVIPRRPAEFMVAFEPTAVIQEQPDASEKAPESGEDRPSGAQEKKSAMLIEPAALEKQLHQTALRILDTRSREEYDRSHVPNAVWVDVKSWRDLGKREGGFRDAKDWAEKVAQVGVNADSRVVVYGDSLSNTARIWWLLKYLGVKEVMILNGGWDLWTKERRSVETDVPTISATQFLPRFDSDRLAEMDPLKDLLQTGKVKVVDTRSEDEFNGKDVRGKRGGHIPGATHLEWKELVAADGRFKTVPELKELFRQRGILPSETAVCY